MAHVEILGGLGLGSLEGLQYCKGYMEPPAWVPHNRDCKLLAFTCVRWAPM